MGTKQGLGEPCLSLASKEMNFKMKSKLKWLFKRDPGVILHLF